MANEEKKAEATASTRVFAQWVENPGPQQERGLLKRDWKAMGIDAPDVWWTPANGHRVDVTDLPTEAVEYLRSMTKEWKVTEEA